MLSNIQYESAKVLN